MVLIDLRHGRSTMVDASDVALLAGHRWHFHSGGYAFCTDSGPPRRTVYMHRLILGVDHADGATEVDHINGNKLDNRRSNLRLVSRSENEMNKKGWSRTGFRGVIQAEPHRWRAYIAPGGVSQYIGSFSSPEEAARARDAAAKKAYGAHAHLNFPEDR